MVDVSTGLLVLPPKQYHRKLFKLVHYVAMRIHNKAAYNTLNAFWRKKIYIVFDYSLTETITLAKIEKCPFNL